MKKIVIDNESGESMVGVLEGDLSSGNLVILCHGSRGSKESSLLKFLSKNIGEKCAVFIFDFSGNGESEGKLEDATYSKGISDLFSVLKYFGDYNIACVIGHSKSATEVLIAQKSLIEYSKSIISISPRIDVGKSQEYDYYEKNKDELLREGFLIYPSGAGHIINENYLRDVEKYFGLSENFEKVMPVMIVHGVEDAVIPIKDSKVFSGRHGVDFFEISGASHSYSSEDAKNDLLDKVSDYLRDFLSR